MKILKIIFLVILFLGVVNAQVENSDKDFRPFTQVKFYADILNFKSEFEGQTRVDAFIQVPYSQVQFVKKDNVFEAEYSVTISVYTEEKEKLVVEKIWSEKITADNFDATLSGNNFNISLKSFDLMPDEYVIRIEVEDKDSRNSVVIENPFVARDLSNLPSISDVMLVANKNVDIDSDNKILPNVTRDVYTQKDGITLFFEYYSANEENIQINYAVLDDENNYVFRKNEKKSITEGKNQIFYTIDPMELGLGKFNLAIAIKDTNGNVNTTISKVFNSRWKGIPLSILDLDNAIEQLEYIAEDDEIDEMLEAESKEEKVKKYLEFWKKKDPVPSTQENRMFEEYYRRVAYANENFSHYREGWKTDRGMVYIILGAPNNVDRHPFAPDYKPYEVWEYYEINRSFVFVDETGFGDYRLVTPMQGDNYRFR